MPLDDSCSGGASYRDAGVDIEAGRKAVDLIKDDVASTFGPEVLTGLGGFAGLYRLGATAQSDPVLVGATDGVGTKLKLAAMLDKHDTVGVDLVAMCVDDVITCGARPLFFLDYLSIGKVVPEKVRDIVAGITRGCRKAGCALLGGETAEHPGVMPDDEYDLAGFCVGVVERDSIIDGSTIVPGDVLVGLASSGLHSNGYSLVRKLFFEESEFNLDDSIKGIAGPLGLELLTPTEIYAPAILRLMEKLPVKGMAHITGGGLLENVPRMLPGDAEALIDVTTWPERTIFQVIQRLGEIETAEMFSVFNMGIGMVLALSREDFREAISFLTGLGHRAFHIGEVRRGDGGICLTS
ncbi:MAG: phosphoribosylformylglycinamidine cyclo-ligase [Candidatus Geothermincolia bacterium]